MGLANVFRRFELKLDEARCVWRSLLAEATHY